MEPPQREAARPPSRWPHGGRAGVHAGVASLPQMPRIVVPFKGADAKRRLQPLRPEARVELALAMLGDVLTACVATGPTEVVTSDEAAAELARELGAALLSDPGGGQGAAVSAALARATGGPILVVNADLPCVLPRDLYALVGAVPPEGLALVAALDGTTNALALSSPGLFSPLFGPGSALRFRAHATGRGVEAALVSIPNLAGDVDSLSDLRRLAARAGARTHQALTQIRSELAA